MPVSSPWKIEDTTLLYPHISEEILRDFGGDYFVIQGYENFIRNRINEILPMFPINLSDGRKIILSGASFSQPTISTFGGGLEPLYPRTARRDYHSYAASVYCTARMIDEKGNVMQIKDDFFLGKIPVMMGSSLDRLANMSREEKNDMGESIDEPGGYFILDGMEYALLNAEKLQINEMYMYPNSKSNAPPSVIIKSTVQTEKDTSFVAMTYMKKDMVVKFTYTPLTMDNQVNALHPLFVLFKLRQIYTGGSDTGFVADLTNLLKSFIVESDQTKLNERKKSLGTALAMSLSVFFDQAYDNASGEISYPMVIGAIAAAQSARNPELNQIPLVRKTEAIERYIVQNVFKNIAPIRYASDTPDDVRMKTYYAIDAKYKTLAFMLYRVLAHMGGYEELDNRDDWGLKKLDTAGAHIEKKFTTVLDAITSSFDVSSTEKTIEAVEEKMPHTKMLDEFKKSFRKKQWGTKDNSKELVIVEKVERESIVDVLALIRKITVQANRSGKTPERRAVQASQFMSVCPIATPESVAVGIIKDIGISAWVSVWRNSEYINKLIDELPKNKTSVTQRAVFYNGSFVGFGEKYFYEKVREARRSGIVPFDTGISYTHGGHIRISLTAGRVCFPLFIVNEETGKLVIEEKGMVDAPLHELLTNGCIEFIDATEMQSVKTYVAEYPIDTVEKPDSYSHTCIDPSFMFGILVSLVPFPNMSQGPRSAYQAVMNKQALSWDNTNANQRFDTTRKIAKYASAPLCPTVATKTMYGEMFPSGRNVMVGIMPLNGGNQEDALLINKGSLDRGLFDMTIYHSVTVNLTKINKNKIIEQIPDKGSKEDDVYSKLDPKTLIVRVGAEVQAGDCIVARVAVTPEGVTIDSSEYLDIGKGGIVEEVHRTVNHESKQVVRIRIREDRKYQVGDKIALAQISQKGVSGRVVAEKDMPYVQCDDPLMDGVRPDILFNPCGLPSRMTDGMLLQLMMGVYIASTGKRIDGTAFRYRNVSKHWYNHMMKEGFNYVHKYTMISGKTGLPLEDKVCIAPIHVQLLKHLVKDKMQARGVGRLTLLNHQPTHGIRKDGGLKSGEMTRDAIIAAGATSILQDRFMVNSDPYRVVICEKCNSIASVYPVTGWCVCNLCGTDSADADAEFSSVNIPYALKLIVQTLASCSYRTMLLTS